MTAQSLSLWAIADSLDMTIHQDKFGFLTGKKTHDLDIDGLKVPVPLQICSSGQHRSGWGNTGNPLVICRCLGNLGILVVSGYKAGAPVTLWLLDFAKMGKPEGYIENSKFTSINQLVADLAPAVVGQFDKDPTNRWHKVV